ncbi:hypothetical protein L1887_02985 [Cichorium endivia]|nr:hypothetical protein L1887_02985 [Cichorium endivia]
MRDLMEYHGFNSFMRIYRVGNFVLVEDFSSSHRDSENISNILFPTKKYLIIENVFAKGQMVNQVAGDDHKDEQRKLPSYMLHSPSNQTDVTMNGNEASNSSQNSLISKLDVVALGGYSQKDAEKRMKITALLVLKCHPIPAGSDPVILANATDVSHFGYFQRVTIRQFIVFVGRTVAKRTPPTNATPSNTKLITSLFLVIEYKVHSYNRNGLCVLGFMDDHYPVRSAFYVLSQVIDEYQKKHGSSWKNIQADVTDQWPYLNDALTRFQHKTIDSVLERGEKLDSLVENSSDLSAASQMHL